MEIIANSVGNLLYEHRYIFAFLGAIFEGNFIMILGGVFYKFGYFKFWNVFLTLLAGYVVNGFLFYYIGFFGGHKILEKWSKKFHLAQGIIEKLEEYFKKHSVKTLFIVRITYGLTMPTFILAGSLKMKLKNFFIVTLLASIIWVLGLMALGYVFGTTYKAVGIVTKTITVWLSIAIFVIIILLSFGIVIWFRKFAGTKFIEKLSQHNGSPIIRWAASIIKKLAKNKNNK